MRLIKTVKKIIEEAEERYLQACENNVPLKEIDKLEENYRKSLKLMEMLETKSLEKTIRKKS